MHAVLNGCRFGTADANAAGWPLFYGNGHCFQAETPLTTPAKLKGQAFKLKNKAPLGFGGWVQTEARVDW